MNPQQKSKGSRICKLPVEEEEEEEKKKKTKTKNEKRKIMMIMLHFRWKELIDIDIAKLRKS